MSLIKDQRLNIGANLGERDAPRFLICVRRSGDGERDYKILHTTSLNNVSFRRTMSTHDDAMDPKDLNGSEIMKPDPKFEFLSEFLSTTLNNWKTLQWTLLSDSTSLLHFFFLFFSFLFFFLFCFLFR